MPQQRPAGAGGPPPNHAMGPATNFQQQRPTGPAPGGMDLAQQQIMTFISNQSGPKNAQKKERPPAIYVANLPENFFNLELEKLFKSKGHKCIGATVCVDHFTKKPLNYGFVSFATRDDAAKAAEAMANYELHGRFLRVSLQNADKDLKDEAANLFVRSLAPEVTQKQLHDFFGTFGKVCSSKLETFSDGKSRCFGFIQFESAEVAQKVLTDYDSDKGKFELGNKMFEVFMHKSKDRSAKNEEGSEAKFTNLFVKNTPPGTDEAKLTEMFEEHGEIQSTHAA